MIITIIPFQRNRGGEKWIKLRVTFGRCVKKNNSKVSVETIYDFQVRCIICPARKADTFDGKKGEKISEFTSHAFQKVSYR